MEVTSQMVRDLREKTGAGMMDCKKALDEAKGNIDQAIEFLRKKGMKNAGKRADKVAAEGIVFTYLHPGDRIGVMVEMNCETDFVARGDDFKALARSIAMHVAWANPPYLNREEVPEAILNTERDIYRSQLKPEQEKMADKILDGKLEKFFQESCLLEQLDARDPSGKKSIGDMLTELSAKVGEKVVLRRFARFAVGEGIEKPKEEH